MKCFAEVSQPLSHQWYFLYAFNNLMNKVAILTRIGFIHRLNYIDFLFPKLIWQPLYLRDYFCTAEFHTKPSIWLYSGKFVTFNAFHHKKDKDSFPVGEMAILNAALPSFPVIIPSTLASIHTEWHIYHHAIQCQIILNHGTHLLAKKAQQ
jgi:hypothetical protein